MSEEDSVFISGFMNNYEIIGHIGFGAFGTVYKCKQILLQNVKEEERVVAVKLIEFKEGEEETVINEINILRNLTHPNIIKIFKSWVEYPPKSHEYRFRPPFDENSKGAIFIETEFCNLKTVRHWFVADWRRREQAKVFLYQIASGVKYLHCQGIIHRDLKPENILLRNEGASHTVIAKICDFGISREIKTIMTSRIGTPGYLSPEVLQGRKYTKKADVYALGVMFYEMLLLGDTKNEELKLSVELAGMMLNEDTNYVFQFMPQCEHLIDSQEKSLIQCMVEVDGENRPHAKEILLKLIQFYPDIENLEILTASVDGQNSISSQEIVNSNESAKKSNTQNITAVNLSTEIENTDISTSLNTMTICAITEELCLLENSNEITPNEHNNFQTIKEKWQETAHYSSNSLNNLPMCAIKEEQCLLKNSNENEISAAEHNNNFQTIKNKWQRMFFKLNPFSSRQNTINPTVEDPDMESDVDIENQNSMKAKTDWEKTFLSFEVTCMSQEVKKTLNVISLLHSINVRTNFVIQLLKKLNYFEYKVDVFDVLERHLICQTTKFDGIVSVCVDPILQAIIRDKLEKEGKLFKLLDKILDIIYTMLISDEVEWPELIHITILWKQAAKRKILVEKYNKHPEWIANQYETAGRYSEGFNFCCESLENLTSILGLLHRSTLKMMYWKGVFHRHLQQYEDALTIQLEVHQRQKFLFGKEDADTLITAGAIGSMYWRRNNLEEAKEWLREALQMTETKFGKENKMRLSLRNDLALVLQDEGKYRESENFYGEMLPLFEKVFGREHSNILTIKHNIACGKEEQGEYDEALNIYEEVLEVNEKILGKTHPSTLITKEAIQRTRTKQRNEFDEEEFVNVTIS